MDMTWWRAAMRGRLDLANGRFVVAGQLGRQMALVFSFFFLSFCVPAGTGTGTGMCLCVCVCGWTCGWCKGRYARYDDVSTNLKAEVSPGQS